MQTTWLSVQLNQDKINDYEIILAQYAGALSQPECLLLKVLSSQSYAQMMSALNQPIRVMMQNMEQSRVFTLKLFKIEYLVAEELMGRNCFLLELRSPLYDLTRFRMTPILKNVSIAEMADLLLTGRLTSQVSMGLQPYRFALEQTDINQPLPVLKGLHESAYDFLSRILRYYGLSYYFDHADQGIMVISDHIAKFAVKVQPQHNAYASGELLTEPHYETIHRRQSASVAKVMAGGHPDTDPEMLILRTTDSQPGPAWQVTAAEFNSECANNHARWTLEALQGEANRNNYSGGGILFPGMIDETEAVLLTQTAYTLEFDGHETGRVRVIPMRAIGQRLEFPYRDLPDLQEHTALLQGSLISDIAGNMAESASVGSSGHYHVLLPDYVIDPQPSRPLLDTRMVYPMQSDDHKEHFTLMNNAEGLLLYNAGTLGESLLLGTANSAAAGHITAQDTAQNAYWQDDSQNKTAFINEGTFDRTQKTGRHAAYMMEAPHYHPEGSGSYLRMGDSIQNDTGYPAQSAESGILMVSTGHYQEEHQGGLLHLSGNAGEDSSQPIPVYREMTQLNPIGTPHILQTSTANRHDDLKTADAVIQNTELTQGTLSESLTAPGLFNTWSADNSREVLVNQNLQQTGTSNNISINTQNKNLSATAYNSIQNATLRTDQISSQTLLRNHKQNLEQYQTLQKSITKSQEVITTQNLAIQNYSRTTRSGVILANQTAMSAGSFAANTNSMQIGSLMMSGAPSSADVAAVEQAQTARETQRQQQNADLKEMLMIKTDDPDRMIQAVPQLCVNSKNPLPLLLNGITTYSLAQDQKQGPITLTFPKATQPVILHPQLRLFSTQNPSLQMQDYKPYFTPQKKMPGYIGLQIVPGATGLGINDDDINVVMLAVKSAPPQQNEEGYNVNTISDDMVTWVMQAIYSVNKVLPRFAADGSEEQGWHWEMPSLSDFGLLFKDGVNALAITDNRRFIMEFFRNGNFAVREVRGQWMLVFRGHAGLRDWVTGTTYSLAGKNKVRIFKSYAKMMTDEGKLTRLVVAAEGAAEDSPLALVIIAPLDMVQYFLLDKDPNKQISDLFVNIGIDLFNDTVAGILTTVIVIALFGATSAGFIVLAGIAVAFLIGNGLKNIENYAHITNILIGLGRKAENHFITQGDILKIDFESFSAKSANALLRVKDAGEVAFTITNDVTKLP